MKCSKCAAIIDDSEESYYSDNAGNAFCFDCAEKELKVPNMFTAEPVKNIIREYISRLEKAKWYDWLLCMAGTVIFSSLSIIVLGWFRVVYIILGATYGTIFILMLIAYYQTGKANNDQKEIN